MILKRLYRAARAAMATAMAAGLALTMCAPAQAQSNGQLQLWTDPATGQVFTRPGKGRVPLAIPYPDISQRVQQVEKQQASVAQEVSQLKASAQKTDFEVQKMQPAWEDFAGHWLHKFSIGALVYADYGLYSHTGYGPQFLTQINPPGPGNEIYNSFDITRTYLDFRFSPDKNFTLRVTPNLYRTVGGASSVTNSKSSSVGSNLDGNLGLRIKYAYLDWKTPFEWNPYLKGAIIRFGQEMNPLVDWEEHLYGYRYVSLTTWNWASLSSTYPGLSILGPVRLGEKTYAEYYAGAYNNASFHAAEDTNTKQVMARLTVFPLGTASQFGGGYWGMNALGITGFYDYGYTDKAPDFTTNGSQSTAIVRGEALIHYIAKTWSVAGSFDWGKNAFSAGNLSSASGPISGTPEADLESLIQSNSKTKQRGFNFFGHYDIPRTPLSVFGWFSQWYSNTDASVNPFDMQRFIVGVEYKYSKHLRFALDSQNLLFYHGQFTVPSSELAHFDPKVASKYASGISYAVPRDTHAIFANLEFSY